MLEHGVDSQRGQNDIHTRQWEHIMYIIPDADYTLNAAAKTITLAAAYSGISVGQITKIIDITTGEILYDADRSPGFDSPRITVSSGVITFTQGNKVANTDKLRIVMETSYSVINGGSA